MMHPSTPPKKGIAMSLKDEFRMMVSRLTAKYSIPPITNIFLPPFCKGGQPTEAEFMALKLAGGATGIHGPQTGRRRNGNQLCAVAG